MFPWFRPVKFITTGAGSELVLNKDIIPLLESETRPVTVVGPYRTDWQELPLELNRE